jgi:hypothetical protein
MRLWNSCLSSRSLARIRLRIVVRRTVNRPSLFFPLICLKPRKSNVSDLPSPLRFRLSSANLPNSIRRVLSGCNSSPNLARPTQAYRTLMNLRPAAICAYALPGTPPRGSPDPRCSERHAACGRVHWQTRTRWLPSGREHYTGRSSFALLKVVCFARRRAASPLSLAGICTRSRIRKSLH